MQFGLYLARVFEVVNQINYNTKDLPESSNFSGSECKDSGKMDCRAMTGVWAWLQ